MICVCRYRAYIIKQLPKVAVVIAILLVGIARHDEELVDHEGKPGDRVEAEQRRHHLDHARFIPNWGRGRTLRRPGADGFDTADVHDAHDRHGDDDVEQHEDDHLPNVIDQLRPADAAKPLCNMKTITCQTS